VQDVDIFVQYAYNIYINGKGMIKMTRSSTNISIRMDAELKAQADALFAELGMNISTAFNIFVRQSLREGRIPFDIALKQPNRETIEAMLEAERIAKDPSVKGYNNLDELFADLEK
jgi:DNA-damage-inducible protein J